MSLSLSVIIPVRNESGNIESLISGIVTSLNLINLEYEILVIDDASEDDTFDVVSRMMKTVKSLRIIRHDRNGGQSAAIHSGVLHARGHIICMLDGDGQNPPEEIPKLVVPFLDLAPSSRLGLVAGQRVGRRDTFSKRIASILANRIRSTLLKDKTRDTGCGLKAFPRSVFLELPYFNHMHRYLPALVNRAGYDIMHVDVSHRQRGSGRSNYSNFQRAFVGIWDLLGVMWLIRRSKRSKVMIEKV